MKLFEIVDADIHREGDLPHAHDIEKVYRDTGETFPSMKAFIAHVKKPENGTKYIGCEWILFPESKNSVPVKFKAVTQYTLDVEEEK